MFVNSRVATIVAVTIVIISYFVSRFLKSRNEVWIAASVLLAGVITSSYVMVFIHIRNQTDERLVHRSRGRLRRSGYINYSYHPLDKSNPKCIRLIELPSLEEARADPNGYLQIKMRISSLDGPGAEPYEAISYCWGDATDLKPTICDGKVILITDSLWWVLGRLHLHGQKRLLWADALCINQRDLTEKSWQVRLMSEIYKNATCILAYLGEDFNHSRQLGEFIPLLAQAKDKIAMELEAGSLSSKVRLTKERQKALGIPPFTRSNNFRYLSLLQLLQRNWFFRVWIIQEIALAKDAIFLCGDWEIPWKTLIAAFEVFEILDFAVADILTVGLDRLRRLIMTKESIPGSPLVPLMFMNRGAGATDPRDHIYALLGIAEDGKDFEVDYAKSVSQVFCDTARKIISSSQQVFILNLVGAERDRNGLDLPSWVPDWRADWILVPLYDHILEPLNIEPKFSNGGLKLQLLGIEIDAVTRLGVCAPRLTDIRGYRPWLGLKIHTCFNKWIDTFQDVFTTLYPSGDEVVYNVFWQIIKDPDVSFDLVKLNMRFYEQQFRLAKWVTSFPMSFNTIFRQAVGFCLLYCPIGLPLAYYWGLPTRQLKFFTSSDYVFGRRMIKTKMGFLGLAPEATEEGHKVFMLHGAMTPVILRPCLVDKGSYELVGECYLHGIMDKRATDMGQCQELTLI